MIQTLSLTQARQDFPSLVNGAKTKLHEYIVTVKGAPAAVIISAAEYESWKETLDIMSDPGLLKAIRKGQHDIENGKYVSLQELEEALQ